MSTLVYLTKNNSVKVGVGHDGSSNDRQTQLRLGGLQESARTRLPRKSARSENDDSGVAEVSCKRNALGTRAKRGQEGGFDSSTGVSKGTVSKHGIEDVNAELEALTRGVVRDDARSGLATVGTRSTTLGVAGRLGSAGGICGGGGMFEATTTRSDWRDDAGSRRDMTTDGTRTTTSGGAGAEKRAGFVRGRAIVLPEGYDSSQDELDEFGRALVDSLVVELLRRLDVKAEARGPHRVELGARKYMGAPLEETAAVKELVGVLSGVCDLNQLDDAMVKVKQRCARWDFPNVMKYGTYTDFEAMLESAKAKGLENVADVGAVYAALRVLKERDNFIKFVLADPADAQKWLVDLDEDDEEEALARGWYTREERRRGGDGAGEGVKTTTRGDERAAERTCIESAARGVRSTTSGCDGSGE